MFSDNHSPSPGLFERASTSGGSVRSFRSGRSSTGGSYQTAKRSFRDLYSMASSHSSRNPVFEQYREQQRRKNSYTDLQHGTRKIKTNNNTSNNADEDGLHDCCRKRKIRHKIILEKFIAVIVCFVVVALLLAASEPDFVRNAPTSDLILPEVSLKKNVFFF